MTTLVKICGLSTPETLDVALDAGADAVGFVFFPSSPRNISFQTARELSARVKGRAKKVALTVDADDTMLTSIVEALHPDMLQLHGEETPARVSAIHQRFDLPVMKVLAIESKADLCEDCGSPAVRRARAARCHPARWAWQAVRLAPA
jgi:phosphoribosylanthranilate isomerase